MDMMLTIEELHALPANQELLKFYESMSTSLDVPDDIARCLSVPLLLQVGPGMQNNIGNSCFIVGQQTGGWGGNPLTIGSSYFTYKEYNGIFKGKFISRELIMQEAQGDFLVDRYGYKQVFRSPFWAAVRDVSGCDEDAHGERNILTTPYHWNNLFAMDFLGDTPLAMPKAYLDELERYSKVKFLGEMRLLKPKSLLFFTGPKYDYVLEKWFMSEEQCRLWRKNSLADLELFTPDNTPKLLVHTFVIDNPEIPDLNGIRCFRTYHPAYLRRRSEWLTITELSAAIKKLLNL